MTNTTLLYAGILLIGVFLSAISQVMLKKAAARQYVSKAIPYNWTRVISAKRRSFNCAVLP